MSDDYSNQTVDFEPISRIEELVPQSLSPKFAWINLIILLSTLTIGVGIGLTIYLQPLVQLPQGLHTFLPYLLFAIAIISGPLGWYSFQANKHKFYALRELDLHYFSGLLFKKVVSQPITRIQHIELKRGPIERKADLATLQVFSAGGAAHTFEIPGLPLTTAKQLRQLILEHKDVAQNG